MSNAYVSPSQTTYRKGQIERLGTDIAKQLGYQPGGDIAAIVAKLGGKIELVNPFALTKNSARPHDESIVIQNVGDFTIYLPGHTTPERDRFTIAHELGHYFVHYCLNRDDNNPSAPMAATRYGSDRVEWEANWFAAGFLMPEESFKETFSAGISKSAKLTHLANTFGVSTAAAEIRAKALGLI